MCGIDRALRLLDMRQAAAAIGRCPLCGPSILIRLQRSAIGVRCVRCRGSAIHLSVAFVILEILSRMSEPSIYELSARGPLVRFLRKQDVRLTCSEFFDGIPSGIVVDGVQCQDVQQLTHADESFDICTSTEVFEHVPDDIKGFREIERVLKPGGHFVFTVPLTNAVQTIERARLVDGRVVHLMEPVYHGDRQRGFKGVLVYRDYGRDICDRLCESGFATATIIPPPENKWWNLGSDVVWARKRAI